MELKGRLFMIASFVPKCSCLCDVGTDHAYIPVYLVQKGICEKALAMDINAGPIEAANENIRHYGLSDKIETRLGSGLEPLNSGEADVVVIAGMGGILIKDILEASFEKAKLVKTIILQPMNAVEVLREWLYENGFEITDEALADEEAKIYNAMDVKWTGATADYEVIDCYIGKHLVDKGGSLFEAFIKRKISQANKVIEGLGKSSEPDREYLKLQEYLRDNYKNILKTFGGNGD